MQTFLPYPNFEKSLKCLDNKRLGKQRVEAYQILNIILKRTKKKGWRNHPAVKMWRDTPNALKLYFNKCLEEWISRGFNNNMKKEIIRGKINYPFWIGSKRFHSSHKSNLSRKDKKYYSRFGWTEKNNLEYIWPIK
ncbi:MAG: hypothetical protein KKB31_00210 [Nanoarchaeota archaeon]|nr:hypothetical protein [Nanoarchaeota archaeon]